MKNKKHIKILLIVTIIIWVLVLYRIFNFSGREEYTEPDFSEIVAFEDFDKSNDSFLLDLNYLDPFMKKTRMKRTEKKTTANINVVKKRSNKSRTVTLPNILYSGCIVNKKNGEILGLLQINNTEYLVTSGEEIRDVKVMKMYGDSIKISYKGITKIVKK